MAAQADKENTFQMAITVPLMHTQTQTHTHTETHEARVLSLLLVFSPIRIP